MKSTTLDLKVLSLVHYPGLAWNGSTRFPFYGWTSTRVEGGMLHYGKASLVSCSPYLWTSGWWFKTRSADGCSRMVASGQSVPKNLEWESSISGHTPTQNTKFLPNLKFQFPPQDYAQVVSVKWRTLHGPDLSSASQFVDLLLPARRKSSTALRGNLCGNYLEPMDKVELHQGVCVLKATWRDHKHLQFCVLFPTMYSVTLINHCVLGTIFCVVWGLWPAFWKSWVPLTSWAKFLGRPKQAVSLLLD